MDQEFEQGPEKGGKEWLAPLTRLDPPPRGGLKLQHLMFGVGVFAVVFWLAIVAGVWFIALLIGFLCAALIGLILILVRRGQTRRDAMLWAMAVAAERSMPLAPTALVFADQGGRVFADGGFRRRVRLLASLLNEGLPLPEALSRVPGALTPDTELLVRVGYATGTLARSLREAASLRTSRQNAWGSTAGRFAYLCGLLLVMQAISGFIMYFIVPKFEAIFHDFGVSLPAATIFVIEMSHVFVKYFYIFAPFLILLEIVVPLVLLSGVTLSLAAWWDLPVVDSLFRRRHSALIMRSLALAVAGNRPIPAVIALLSDDYHSGGVRYRLQLVGDDLQQGRDWVEALAARALIRPADAAVIRAAQRVGNLDWALRESADAVDRRLGYRLQFWLQMLFPVLIIGMGGLVALFAVAYFSPLVRLIETLAR